MAGILDLAPLGREVDVLLAAIALDRAAGLASDCQRPKETTAILRRHLGAYAELTTLSVPVAIAMLEPATDLARLHAIAGRTDQALSWLTHLMHAVRTGSRTPVDRYMLSLDRVDGAPEELRLLRDWAWSRLLADAVKVLAVAGRWSEASDLVTRHSGPATRLTETRQVLVVAHLVDGELEAARHHLAETTPTELWEVEVASCLRALAAEPADRADEVAAMLTTFRQSRPEPLHAAYRARYGVTVARLAHATGHPYADIARQLAAEAITLRDGHAAREVLRNVGGCLSRKDVAALTRNVTRAGLTGDHLTGYNLTRLRATVHRAATNLHIALHHPPR
ncbi:hypothetical protein [Promicromonospora aerolata]|uniref:Uncharacterized protein n=1 Tax=Promicromonospora aerolata TaxID=195749 RepID=A0ABW4UZS3_9MICO